MVARRSTGLSDPIVRLLLWIVVKSDPCNKRDSRDRAGVRNLLEIHALCLGSAKPAALGIWHRGCLYEMVTAKLVLNQGPWIWLS